MSKKLDQQKSTLQSESDKMALKGGCGCLIPIVIGILLLFSVFDHLSSSMLWVLFGISCVGGIYGVIYMIKSSVYDEKIADITTIQKLDNLEDEKNKLIEKYGKIDKEIYLEKYNIKKYILVFEESQKVWILGNVFSFPNILNVSCDDNQSIKHGDAKLQTKTGSMVARTVVGSAVMGVPGAIIGGATAKKTINQANDTIIHNYTINVIINSINSSMITIHVGSDEYLKNDILGLFQVIISRYQH